MALTGTDRGTGSHNTSATTFTLSPASNFTAGSIAVLCVAADNANTSGNQFSTFSVSDSLGNTWTQRQLALADPGAANAGVAGCIFTTGMNAGPLVTGTVITVTFNTATTAKAWTLMEVVGTSGTRTDFVTSGVGTASTASAPTVTTSSLTSGDCVIGATFAEHGAPSFTGDSDTTNGSWSTQQTVAVGSTTSGVAVSSQRKVVNATGAQTYNPTIGTGSVDCVAAWISVRETTLSMTATQASFTMTGNAANLLAGYRLTAAQASYTLTGNATALFYTHARSLLAEDSATVLMAEDGSTNLIADISPLEATTASFTVTGNDAALKFGAVLAAAQGSYSLTGYDVGLTYGGGAVAAKRIFVLT